MPGDPRPIVAADLARIAEIERTLFADPWSRDAFADALARDRVLGVALDGATGLLVGYGLCVLAGDEGEILNLAVDPPSQRAGLGRRLLESMLQWLRQGGASRVYLEVRGSNASAIALYQAAGFGRLGVRHAYYRSPREDAVTMVLEVGPESALKG